MCKAEYINANETQTDIACVRTQSPKGRLGLHTGQDRYKAHD